MLFAVLLSAAAPAMDVRPLIEADRRLVAVGRRLARGGAGLCAGSVSNPGWTIADVEQYRPALRPAVTAVLSLSALPTVVAVEPDSPAGRAGVRAGDAIAAIDGRALPAVPAGKAVRDRLSTIERSAPPRSAALRRGRTQVSVSIAQEPGCPSHFLVGRAKGLRGVSSDGRQVGVSAEMLDYAASDDELALVLAHELAHNILGHNKGVAPTRAAGTDRSGRAKKSREAEADRWALYLMARAGYDVSVAPGFWRRWGPKTSFGIFSAGTHPGWRERAAAAEAEIAKIRAQQAAGQRPVP